MDYPTLHIPTPITPASPSVKLGASKSARTSTWFLSTLNPGEFLRSPHTHHVCGAPTPSDAEPSYKPSAFGSAPAATSNGRGRGGRGGGWGTAVCVSTGRRGMQCHVRSSYSVCYGRWFCDSMAVPLQRQRNFRPPHSPHPPHPPQGNPSRIRGHAPSCLLSSTPFSRPRPHVPRNLRPPPSPATR